MNNRHYPLVFRATAGLLFVILLVLVLYHAADVLVILAFAILFSYLLYPLTSWLEGKKIPRGVANILAIILFIAVFVSAGFLLYKQGARLMGDFPELKEHALDNIGQMETFLEDKLPFVPQGEDEWLVGSVSDFLTSGEETF